MKYNDIGLNLKKLFGRVFAVLLCLSVVFFAACSQDEQDPGEGEQEQPTVTEETGDYISASRGYGQGGLICTPEAFAAAKDGWFRSDGKISKLLSDEANDASLTEVTAGETYYYVYSWNVQYESLPEEYDVHHIGSEETYTSAFRLSVLPGDGKMYFNNAAVTFGEPECVDVGETLLRTNFTYSETYLCFIRLNIPYGKDIKAVYCIPFVPNVSGRMYIEQWWQKKGALDSIQSVVFANVFEPGEEERGTLQLGGISCDLNASENLLNIRFDTTLLKMHDVYDRIYCEVYVIQRRYNLFTFRLEEAPTSDYMHTQQLSGKVYRVGFRVPERENETENHAFTMKYEAEDENMHTAEGVIVCEVYVAFYGDGVRLQGQTKNRIRYTESALRGR